MTKVILSTATIVEEFKKFERLFEFYKGGIRGLIEDSMLLAADRVDILPHSLKAHEAMVEKVMAEYETSVQYRELEYSYPDCQPSVTIEYVMEMITAQVNALLNQVFIKDSFEVQPLKPMWLGDDLILTIHVRGKYRA